MPSMSFIPSGRGRVSSNGLSGEREKERRRTKRQAFGLIMIASADILGCSLLSRVKGEMGGFREEEKEMGGRAATASGLKGTGDARLGQAGQDSRDPRNPLVWPRPCDAHRNLHLQFPPVCCSSPQPSFFPFLPSTPTKSTLLYPNYYRSKRYYDDQAHTQGLALGRTQPVVPQPQLVPSRSL